MVGSALGAAFVVPSRPELGHLCVLLAAVALDWGKGFRVPDDEGDTAALAAFRPLTAAAHNAAAADARVGTETVPPRAAAVEDVELGNENPPVADELRSSHDITEPIFRLEVGLVAAAGRAGHGLLVGRDDVPLTILLRETPWQKLALDRAPVVIFPCDHGGRDRRRMLDVLHLTASRSARAETAHEESGLLVDPRMLLLLVGILPVEVVRLADDPVDGWLAATYAAALARGLRDDHLLCLAEAIHRHGAGRSNEKRSVHAGVCLRRRRRRRCRCCFITYNKSTTQLCAW